MISANPVELLNRLPHRPPFRFITGDIDIRDGREGGAVWEITGEENFLSGHFPGAPIVPGVLIGEALAQLSGLVAVDQIDRARHASAGVSMPTAAETAGPAGHGHGIRHQGRLAHIDLRFNHAVAPPAKVRLESKLTRIFATLWQFEVSAFVADINVARGHLALSIIGGAGTPEIIAS